MPKASKNFPQIGQRDEPQADLGFRQLQVRASSIDEASRTIEADITTESPVPMPDWSRMEMVNEVLLSSGAEIPKSRQVPFLDSHNRYSVKDQLGSAREVTVDGNKLTARLHFSEAAESEFTKVREGHVTDVSAGYEIKKRVFVPAGESRTFAGRSFDGPVNVVTKWRLREVSLTPIGADAQAKLRGLDPAAFSFRSPQKGQWAMNEEFKKWLVSRGMSAELTDEQAQVWVRENPEKLIDRKGEKKEERKTAETPAPFDAEKMAKMIADETRKAIEAEQKRQAAFRKEVDGLCELAGLADERDTCREMTDLDAVRKHLLDTKAKRAEEIPFNASIRVTGDGFQRMQDDVQQAISLRALQNTGHSQAAIDRVMPVEKRSQNLAQWRNASLYDMAAEVVRASGVDTRGLSREEVAMCAMFGSQRIGVRSGGAYHTTGSFANLTLDAVNKSMGIGYTETPATWRGPMRQGSSVQDFKDKHTIRLGAVPNLPVWNDNSNPEKAGVADAKVSYAVEARSLEIDFSYRLLVNDDMDALSRIPAQMGAAAARTVNAVAWSQITSNPTMPYDSVALFATATGNRKRTNLSTGTATPTVATLQTMSNLMRQMRGENTPENGEGQDILNLMPRYIVGPSALETTIKQLVLSAYDPAATNHLTYNTATSLMPVIEPLLDTSSTTAWYVFADPSQIDTVEVSFLQGQESPVVRSFMDERKLSQSFIILQSFAAKAINHRGIQKHAGV